MLKANPDNMRPGHGWDHAHKITCRSPSPCTQEYMRILIIHTIQTCSLNRLPFNSPARLTACRSDCTRAIGLRIAISPLINQPWGLSIHWGRISCILCDQGPVQSTKKDRRNDQDKFGPGQVRIRNQKDGVLFHPDYGASPRETD